MMNIQLKTKEYFNIILIIFLCFVMTGCDLHGNTTDEIKTLTEDSFREIKAGMTEERVKILLGKPDKIIDEEKEVQDARYWDSDNSIDIWATENPDVYNEFYGDETNKKEYYKLLKERKDDMVCYEYKYMYNEDEEDIWHIYFIDGKVATMYFP